MEVILIGVWILLCLLAGKFAAHRGRSAVAWFALSLLISPLIVFLLLLLLNPRDESPPPPRAQPAPSGSGALAFVIALLILLGGAWFYFGVLKREAPPVVADLLETAGLATPAPLPRANAQVQAAAAARYPALRQAGSPLHTEFMARTKELAKSQPAFFDNADWPTRLAGAIQNDLTAETKERARAAAAAAAQQQAKLAAAEQLYFRVAHVAGAGAIVQPYRSYAIADGISRFGGGGNVGTGYKPDSKLVFVHGLPAATEGQNRKVLAYRDGAESVNDGVRDRTLEKWVFVSNAGN